MDKSQGLQTSKAGPIPLIKNEPAQHISYFTPAQQPPSGCATEENSHVPKLFQPLTIRGLTFQNRIMVSPMCQYSAENGRLTDWHFAHLGGIVSRGPGLTFVEATSVTANGRITPEDSGLYDDSQIPILQRIVEFAHSQNQKIGIQLGHAGRKASTVAPWLNAGATAAKEVGGWPDDVYAPSAVAYNDKFPQPKEMTKKDIEDFKKAFVESVKRALKAGFDVIEIHNAHGYLLHEYVSKISNTRGDEYGGSFENRTRLTREVIELTRATIPKDMPLFLRISATDGLEEVPEIGASSWTIKDTVQLAEDIADLGVDLIDVSGGGLHPQQKIKSAPAYQAPFAKAVKEKLGDRLLVGTVGMIQNGKLANQLLDDGLDTVLVARGFQKDPSLVWTWADELGVDINVASQIRWGFKGRGGQKKK